MVRFKDDGPRGILNARKVESGVGLARYWPSDDLAPFVEHYWIVRWNLTEPRTAETLPYPSVHMVLEDGRSEVVGVMRGRFSRVLREQGRVLGTKFRPGAFRPFVDRAVSSYTDRRWPLADVFPKGTNGFDTRALSHDDDTAAIAVIEAFLRSLHPATSEAMLLAARVTGRIAADRSITRVDQIVAEEAMTARQLQRLFREYVGVTPKWVIQRYRLIEAAERLAAGTLPDLASLALDLGYADQPHFIRDFKRIVGRTPADYARSLGLGAEARSREGA